MSLNETPSANRIHIGFYGKRNSGKSSLINAFTGQQVAIVSDVAGTTTDPVYKPMEVHGLGPCVFIDTAGVDDVGELGKMRVEKTEKAAEKTDIAVLLFSGEEYQAELEWFHYFKEKHTPTLCVLSKADTLTDSDSIAAQLREETKQEILVISSKSKEDIEKFKEELIRLVPDDYGEETITGALVEEGDLVLLVMPQDIQAPKGRLILPQVQTIRELLDKKCRVVCCTTDQIEGTLSSLAAPPKLIITDSQVFSTVYAQKPAASLLTSFSVLFARYKGDIDYFVESAAAIGQLREDSRVLIAEACTHAPVGEDIGRVKIPAMLRKRIGPALRVDVVAGTDFPADLTPYDLVIHCGACMFNRRHVLSRVAQARAQHVPMTNYGVAIAYLQGILDKIEY